FFTDYGDPHLQKAVTEGRRHEFRAFGDPDEPVSDPQDPASFESSKLNWRLAESENPTLEWYRSLLGLRRKYIIEGERTCQAEFVDGVIHLQVPRAQPRVRVFARVQGRGRLPEPAAGWERVMEHEENGYAVAVCVKDLNTNQNILT